MQLPQSFAGGGPEVIERDGRKYALVPLEDYPGMAETAHLLKSEENAAELAESIGWLNRRAGGEPFDTPDGVQQGEDEVVEVPIEQENPRGVIPRDARIFSKVLAWAEKTVDSPEGLTSDDLDHFRYVVVRIVLPSLLEPLPETATNRRKDGRTAIVNTLVYEPNILVSKLTSGLVPTEPSNQINREKATSK